MESVDLYEYIMSRLKDGAHGFTLRSNDPLDVHDANGKFVDSTFHPDAFALLEFARKLLPSRELRDFRSGDKIHAIVKIDDYFDLLIGAKISDDEVRIELRKTTFQT